MFCHGCGRHLSKTVRFCPSCGTRVSASQQLRTDALLSTTSSEVVPLQQETSSKPPTKPSFLGSLACKVGVHNWNTWNYLFEGQCKQSRICERCSHLEERTHHTWGDNVYGSPQSCQQMHICQRCNLIEDIQIIHAWSEWRYVTSNSCSQTHVCVRCNMIENRVTHLWCQLDYESAKNCTMSKRCQRCSELNDRITVHQWGDWSPLGQDGEVRTCYRCGSQENRKSVTLAEALYGVSTSIDLTGLYVTFKSVYYPNTYMYQEYYLFLPQGRVFNALPTGGQLDRFDFVNAHHVQPDKCGSYSLRGNQIVFNWPSRPRGQQEVRVNFQQLRNGIKLDQQDYYRVRAVTSLVLNGTYHAQSFASGNVASISASQSIAFSQNGLFSISSMSGAATRSPGLGTWSSSSTNSGKYSISGTTLTLQYKGRTEFCTFFVYPDGEAITSQPDIIVIDDRPMIRLP